MSDSRLKRDSNKNGREVTRNIVTSFRFYCSAFPLIIYCREWIRGNGKTSGDRGELKRDMNVVWDEYHEVVGK